MSDRTVYYTMEGKCYHYSRTCIHSGEILSCKESQVRCLGLKKCSKCCKNNNISPNTTSTVSLKVGCLSVTITVIFFFLFLASCGVIKSAAKKDVEETTPVKQETVASEKMSVEDFASMVDSISALSYEEGNYEVTFDDTSVTVNHWSEGITIEIMSQFSYDSISDNWEELISTHVESTNSVQDLAEQAGLDGITIIFALLDENTKEEMLVVSNGEVIYNFANSLK